jgi:hypothetical protein
VTLRASHTGCLLFALLLSLGLVCGCQPLCGNDVLDETKSPSGKLKAVVFERDCGAMTRFSYQVSLIPSNENLPSGAGNVFTADDNHGAVVAMYIKTRWESDHSLVIEYPKNTRVFSKRNQVAGVSISYQTPP